MAGSLEIAKIQKLLNAAIEAKETSYSPYSKFRVGAALLLEDGEIVIGANVENASYGAGICAERTALVKHQTNGLSPRPKILAIGVSSDLSTPCPPCGICRQFIREFCTLSTPVYMPHGDWQGFKGIGEDVVTVRTLEQLLPLSFGPEDLERSSAEKFGEKEAST